MDLALSKKKKVRTFSSHKFSNKSATLLQELFFTGRKHVSEVMYMCNIYKTPLHGASFIHAFHIRILRFQGLGGRVAVGSCCLLSSTLRQRSPPYTGCIKSWKMDILIRAYIDKQSLLLRHCLLSPWWFMGDAYRVYYARNNISLTRDSRTFE